MSARKVLKVGDHVERRFGHDGPTMPMKVTKIEDGIITCCAIDKDGSERHYNWTFDEKTGVEEDAEFGWGVKFGVTGSVLKLED